MNFDNNPRINGIGDILISSRSLCEYRAMFALTNDDLSRRILDCPGGGAGFTSEVSSLGGDATACDIAYFHNSATDLAAIAVSESDRGNRYVRAHAPNTRGRSFPVPTSTSASGVTLPNSSQLIFAATPTTTCPDDCRHCRSLMPVSIWYSAPTCCSATPSASTTPSMSTRSLS